MNSQVEEDARLHADVGGEKKSIVEKVKDKAKRMKHSIGKKMHGNNGHDHDQDGADIIHGHDEDRDDEKSEEDPQVLGAPMGQDQRIPEESRVKLQTPTGRVDPLANMDDRTFMDPEEIPDQSNHERTRPTEDLDQPRVRFAPTASVDEDQKIPGVSKVKLQRPTGRVDPLSNKDDRTFMDPEEIPEQSNLERTRPTEDLDQPWVRFSPTASVDSDRPDEGHNEEKDDKKSEEDPQVRSVEDPQVHGAPVGQDQRIPEESRVKLQSTTGRVDPLAKKDDRTFTDPEEIPEQSNLEGPPPTYDQSNLERTPPTEDLEQPRGLFAPTASAHDPGMAHESTAQMEAGILPKSNLTTGSTGPLEEDPHPPEDRPHKLSPSNYQTKISDPPASSGGEETGDQCLPSSFEGLRISDDQEVGHDTFTACHDQSSPESPPVEAHTISQNSQQVPEKPHQSQPSNDQSYTSKIYYATSAIAGQAASAKNAVASKLGYGGTGEGDETKTDTSEKSDVKVAETEGGLNRSEKGVPVSEYLAGKLEPGAHDKALAEVILDSFQKRKEETEADQQPVTGSVSDSGAGEGLVGRINGAVGSLFGMIGQSREPTSAPDNQSRDEDDKKSEGDPPVHGEEGPQVHGAPVGQDQRIPEELRVKLQSTIGRVDPLANKDDRTFTDPEEIPEQSNLERPPPTYEQSNLERTPPTEDLDQPRGLFAPTASAHDLGMAHESTAHMEAGIPPKSNLTTGSTGPLEEDPHPPEDRPHKLSPSNYQIKISDPPASEIVIDVLMFWLRRLMSLIPGLDGLMSLLVFYLNRCLQILLVDLTCVYFRSLVNGNTEGGEETRDQCLPSSSEGLSISDDQQVGHDTFTACHDQFSPESPPVEAHTISQNSQQVPEKPHQSQPSNDQSYTSKIYYATSAIASKLGYGGTGEGDETKTDTFEKSDVKVAETEGGLKPSEKGVPVREYLAGKLEPGADDKAPSEVISDSFQKRKEETEADQQPVTGSVSDSGAGVGVVGRIKGAVGSLFGMTGKSREATSASDNQSREVQGGQERQEDLKDEAEAGHGRIQASAH